MSTLDNLKKEAKRWLKALRLHDAEARARLTRAYPTAPAAPGLRDVQHALAREHGHANWKAMLDALNRPPAPSAVTEMTGGRTHAERVRTFLEFACWDHHVHGKGDHRMYDCAAGRILAQHPEIAHDSICTAIVCGDFAEVERILAERPEAAREAGGSRGWTPILYLTYTRFTYGPTIQNALAIGRALLDHGANPNDFYQAGDVPYTALVGVAGEGEQDSPRQPYAEELFQLLLERGAEPFDGQILYNTHFSGDMQWWLELIYAHTRNTPRGAAWDDPDWKMLDMGGYGPGAYFIIRRAGVEKNNLKLAEWALSHGASPNSIESTNPKFKPKWTLYQEAVIRGFSEMADLLVRYGAKPEPPVLDSPEDEFAVACFALDQTAARKLLEAHAEYIHSPNVMFAAARLDRPDEIALLLDLGTPLEIADRHNTRALHHAAAGNSLRAAAYLIERGAEIDPKETNWGGAPIGWAAHGDKREMMDFLSQYSKNVWTLAFRGYVERLREVLQAEPELAKAISNDGITPLWWLPDDESKALQTVELLIANGANPSARSKHGTTALSWALKRGMRDVAALLDAAMRKQSPHEQEIANSTAILGLAEYEALAQDLVTAYETGYAPALQHICKHYDRAVTWEELRKGVQQSVRMVPDSEKIKDGMYEGYFALPHARLIIARQAGLDNWEAFVKSLEGSAPSD